MRLNPQHLTVAQLMQGRMFRIPDYQRAYSWQERQRKDLFDDIREVHRSSQPHFMATVVGLARESRSIAAEEFNVVDLVDGQQRVTTIVILLKAIEKALNESDPVELAIKKDIARLMVKGDAHNLILLQTNHDSSDVFHSYIRNGAIRCDDVVTAADENIINAARESEKFVDYWRACSSLVELVSLIRNKLSVIYHELHDEVMVYRVFEVLNSRGLDVRWIDKTKSQLMAMIYEHVSEGTRTDGLHEMHNLWRDIYRCLGLEENLGTEALRFAGTLCADTQPSRVLSEQDASETLLRLAGNEIAKIVDSAKMLKTVVGRVVDLHKDHRRTAVTRISQARFLAVAIMLRNFDKETERELLLAWEKMTFRIFTLAGKDSRTKVGDYIRLGYEIYRDKLPSEKILDVISHLGADFEIASILDQIRWDDWYGGYNEDVRYLLYRYEEHLARKKGITINESQWAKVWAADPARSIEHIMPQSSGERYVHHLGNLTMLPPGVNSSLKDKSPQDKAARYIECGMQATIAVGRSIEHDKKWNEDEVKKRAMEIREFIATEWAE